MAAGRGCRASASCCGAGQGLPINKHNRPLFNWHATCFVPEPRKVSRQVLTCNHLMFQLPLELPSP